MARFELVSTTRHPKTLAIGVQAPYNRTKNIQAYYDEFLNLLSTNLIEPDVTHFLKLREIDSTTFLTTGKLEEVRKICEEHQIEEVVISEPLTPQQERNLGSYINAVVFDRTQLILEIFEKATHSAEGKLQVEIALLKHKKGRLAGLGIELSQQAGFKGMRAGPGETIKEIKKRHINEFIQKSEKKLEEIEKIRSTQRKQRLENTIPQVCLVGYTNAGKSSILNGLTKSSVLAEDKLFATLDTTTRELFLTPTKRVLISDTVGFIQFLPPHLIEAFKSTLSELAYANLLLLVIDVSDPDWQNHVHVVREILSEIEVDRPILYVFNKADKVESIADLEFLFEQYQPYVITSTTTKDGLVSLRNYLISQNF
jgi:GTP-binding protein HflX